jgi:ribosomal protein L6P/L9E
MTSWTKTNSMLLTKISSFELDKALALFKVNSGILAIGDKSILNNSVFKTSLFLLKSEKSGTKLLNRNNLMQHNTAQTLLYNNILGVYSPFIKVFVIRGIGYQVDVVENTLDNDIEEFPYERYLSLRVGHSFHLYIPIPNYIGVKVSYKDRKLVVYGANKEYVANFAKAVFKMRPPSVYTGRGIRIKKGMHRRKLGKKDIRKGKV